MIFYLFLVIVFFSFFQSNQEAVDIVGSYPCTSAGAEEAARALVEESVKRWNAEEEVVDDITALLVYF
jgi:hypothetical protein